MTSSETIGRLAPSPTGALHLGNARSFLLAWLSIRQQAGTVILRIEDIDSPRVKPWAVRATIADLRWLGLDWDLGPESYQAEPNLESTTSQLAGKNIHHPPSATPEIPLIQSERMDRYRQLLGELIAQRRVYRCNCSRKEIAQAASAPHESHGQPLEGPIYPGTCRPHNINMESQITDAPAATDLSPTEVASSADKSRTHQRTPTWTEEPEFAYRWAFDDGNLEWFDSLHGRQSANPLQQLGDFVVGRSNGNPAYQLAVVTDDSDMGVTEVVRGDDLIYSTYRQLSILQHLGWPIPNYYHVPLIVGPDGRRLAKRHGDTRLSFFREQEVAPEGVVGYLAWSLGLLARPQAISARELVGRLEWRRLSLSPTVFDLSEGLPLLQRMN